MGNAKNTSKEDLSLIISSEREFGEVFYFIQNYEGVAQVEVIEEYKDGKLGKDKKAVLVRIEFEESANISEIKNSLVKLLQDKFNISVRK